MDEKTVIRGENFFHLSAPASFGVVSNVRYVMCFWPPLDEPTALFAEGSSGIEVQGPPTPRNVVFPEDTVFLSILVNDGTPKDRKWRETKVPTKADSFFVRETRMQEVERTEKVTQTIKTESGAMVEATFYEPTKEVKEVPFCLDLTPELARQVSDVVAERKK